MTRQAFAAEVVEGPVVLIAPDVPHTFHPQGRNAMIFIEPESRTVAAVLRDLAGRRAARLDPAGRRAARLDPAGRRAARLDPAGFADIATGLSCIWGQTRPDYATLVAMGPELASRLAGNDVSVPTIDKRIARVLARLSERPDTRLDAGQAVEIVCLSESRFSHLFVAEVGLPYRTYVLWRRLMVGVNRIAAGNTLTDATHWAGFADAAHFSRTFLRMFGVPASLLHLI